MPIPRMIAKEDQPPDVRRECGGDRAESEHEHLVAVDSLAAQHVGDPAEQDGAKGRSEQGGRCDEAFLGRRNVPFALQQRHHDADNEKVVGVSEEAHARDEHDFPMQGAEFRLIHLGENIRVGGLSNGHEAPHVSIRQPRPIELLIACHGSRAVCRVFVTIAQVRRSPGPAATKCLAAVSGAQQKLRR